MVKKIHGSVISTTLLLGLSLFALPMEAQASGTVYNEGKTVDVLGATMGAQVTASTTAVNQTVSNLALTSLGSTMQALFSLTNPPNTIDGVSYTEVYSFGKRVFTDTRSINSTTPGQVSVGIAPTQIRVPFLVYPVGPLSVRVDGGARFLANLSMSNMTEISIPIQYTAPGVQLTAAMAGAGYVEGYAELLMIRGGIGGQVSLVDAHLDINSRYSFEDGSVLVTVSAIAEFFKGRIYAFLDMFGFFSWGWKRLIDQNLYSWNGYCVATKDLTCPGK